MKEQIKMLPNSNFIPFLVDVGVVVVIIISNMIINMKIFETLGITDFHFLY